MRALLLIAHGSRRAESNAEVGRLAERLAAHAATPPVSSEAGSPAPFDIVEHAFLELAGPSIPDGIERCIARGARSVAVVPYFLAAGTHVADDIPEIVARKREEHPDRDIRLTAHLGTSPVLVDALLALAAAADAAR